MTKSFDDLWRYITQERPGVITVQERMELKHVFDLMRGCDSYLEVGTAEGNSLYVLSHALKEGADITYIDYGEKHTAPYRGKIISLVESSGYKVKGILGDSNDFSTRNQAFPFNHKQFDVVLIDAGHDDFNVAIDAILYGVLASKYIIFHDVCLSDVARAFDWYVKQRPDCESYKFINSDSFGYGIMRVKNG